MTNKRELKQHINLICDELYIDFIAASLYGNNPTQADIESLFASIAKLQADTLSRVSHPEPGMPAKKYFKDLKEQFRNSVLEIADQINNL